MTNYESGAYWEQPLCAWTVHRGGDVRPFLPDYDALPQDQGVSPVGPIVRGGAPQGEYWLSHPERSEVSYDPERQPE